MKIQSKKSRTRKLLYLCIAGVILVGAGLAYAASTHTWPFPETSTSKSTGKTSSDSTDQNLTPDTSKDSTGTTDTPTNPKTPTQSTGGETATPTTPDTIGVTITHITPNGSYVMVGSNIEEITTSGTCTLVVTKGSTNITMEAGIQPLASSSTCKGFNVPTSKLSPGTWTFTISVKIGDKTGKTNRTYIQE